MRILVPLLLALILTGCTTTRREAPASVEIERIIPRHIEAGEFVRIDEYLTSRENQGDRVIVRSQPEDRGGYYFVLVLDQPVRRLPRGTRIHAEIVAPSSPDVQEFDFELPAERPRTKEIFVGLTGTDWPDARAVPGAWRFTLTDANGKFLGSAKSYLWSL